MEEEMLRNDKVFVMGEEVARYNGAYKVSTIGQDSNPRHGITWLGLFGAWGKLTNPSWTAAAPS